MDQSDDRSVPLKTLLRWSEALAGIARTGLGFTESLYERERFEEILKVAADIRVEADGESDDPDYTGGLVQEWMDTVGKGVPGYVTPKVAVGAAVGNDKGELLLIQRADSGIWLYPTGWCDIGYSAAEVVVKEVEEETGIIAEPVRLIAVLDGLRLGMTRVPLYSLLFYCRAIGGELNPHPARDPRRRLVHPRDTLPFPLVGSERWGDHVFAAIEGEEREVLYDRVRQPMWRGDPDVTDVITVEIAAAVDDELCARGGRARPPAVTLGGRPARRCSNASWRTRRQRSSSPAMTASWSGMLTLASFQIPTGVRSGSRTWWSTTPSAAKEWRPRSCRRHSTWRSELGRATVDLTSRPDREAANRLYQRMGFAVRATNVYRRNLEAEA